MTPNPQFLGTVEDGKLSLVNPQRFDRYLLNLVGEVVLTIKRNRKKRERSLAQNRYYWGVPVAILAENFGYSDEEMHEALKWQFLKKHEGRIPTVRSTTDLSTVEMENLLSKIRQWASSEFGVYIPTPNETEFSY